MLFRSRFVPAKQAYLGDAITSWLTDPRASKERWLILSARYGFIDPDQPIENYDVTFSDASTGPITDDALAAQVRCQVRWRDAVPLKQFSRVVVHGHHNYVERVRSAFSALGARVLRDDERVEVVDRRERILLQRVCRRRRRTLLRSRSAPQVRSRGRWNGRTRSG